jgi:hypothetical protein
MIRNSKSFSKQEQGLMINDTMITSCSERKKQMYFNILTNNGLTKSEISLSKVLMEQII